MSQPPAGEPRAFTAYFVPHTHWDREWYRPFETFRARLVQVIDCTVDLLQNDPAYRCFLLDGQTIVLRDYLAVRPEREPVLRTLIQEGRMRIGPWYVLADEFLVSPEALVRNLALGQRDCAAFGDRLPIAYTPDSFGHVSQLPLLARGFGFEAVVFERGVGDEGERLRGEFTWSAADGESQVFAVHLLATYSSAAAVGHADWEMRDGYDPDRARRHVQAALYGADGLDLDFLPPWIRESLERIPGGVTAYATGDALLLLNGSDHLFPQVEVPRVLRDLNEHFSGVRFEHGDLEDYVRHARASAGELARHQGEFRGSRYQHVLSGVLSSRIYLKQANHQAETRLERYTEPLAALARLTGTPHPAAVLHHAWSKLLENHPHDSICGCSIDAVHDEMMPRFAAVHHVADHVEEQALRVLVGEDGTRGVSIFNPHPYPLTRTVEATLKLPAPPDGPLELVDANGAAVPADIEVEAVFAAGRSDERRGRCRIRAHVALPPLGFAWYTLREAASAAAPAQEAPVRTGGADREGLLWLENDALRLEVTSDGALTLMHRTSGERYPLGLCFEDAADAGDEYDFDPLEDDRPIRIDRLAQPPRLVERSGLRARVRLDYRAELPERLDEGRRARVGLVACPIALELALEAGSPTLQMRATVDNEAEDHRLRLRVATGCRVPHVHAEGHFDVLERPVRPPAGEGWFQTPQPTNHQRRFVLAADGQRGLAVLNRGLPEYQADEGAEGVEIAVTLIRAVGWLSRNDLRSRPQGAGPPKETPGGQCPGRHVFELALYPFAGSWWRSDLMREVEVFAAPPRAHATAAPVRGRAMLAVEPPLVVSAFKPSDGRDAVLVRLWNPAPEAVERNLELGFAPREAHEVRLDETRLRAIPLEGGGSRLPLSMSPQQVRTLELVLPTEEVVSFAEI